MKNLKFSLCLFVLLILGWSTQAQNVQIGSGTATGGAFPISGGWGYTYTQQIYTQPQVNTDGEITKIRFYYVTGAPTQSLDWVIYMGHTDKTSFSSITDWVPVSEMTEVFNGQVTYPAIDNWMEITLTTPFPYNNTDNLVIAVDENTPGYSAISWRTFTSGTNTGIYYRNDDLNPDPAAPPTANSTSENLAQVQLYFLESCPAPTDIAITNITYSSADISWTPGAFETAWNIIISETEVSDFASATIIPAATNPYSASALSPGTTYYVYVQANCGADDVSNWSEQVTFAVAEKLSWYNLEVAATDTIYTTETLDVYAQAWKDGVTNADAENPGVGVECWIGFNHSNTNPATWTSWMPATYSADVDENDQFTLSIDGIPPGKYYYASRWSYNHSIYTYGGRSSEGGGAWDGITNASGVLIVKALGANCSDPIIVDISANLPYEHFSQSNCGMENTYDNTNISNGDFDNGQDVIYQLNLSSDKYLKITMDPKITSSSSLSLFSDCPDVGTLIDDAYDYSSNLNIIEVALSAGTYYLMIDCPEWQNCIPDYDLTIEEICPEPYGIEEFNLAQTSTDIRWIKRGFETAWNIKVNEAAPIDPETEEGDIVANAEVLINPTYSIASGLTLDTEYYVYVQASCGSEWAEYIFTTLAACPIPTGLETEVLGTNAATLTWNKLGMSDWVIKISASSFDPDTYEDSTVVTSAIAQFELTGLTAGTIYYWYVKSSCGSDWSYEGKFTTECEAISTFPWTEDFEGVSTPDLPMCWSQIDNNSDGEYWETTDDKGVENSQSVTIYTDNHDGNNDDYLILPKFLLTGNQQLMYYVRARSNYEPNDYRVVLSTTGKNPEDFNVELLPLTVVSSTTMTEINPIDLSSYSGEVYIAIHIPSGGLDGWRIYFDNFTIEDIPSCPKPTNLFANVTSTTSAILNWNENGSATNWTVKVSLNPIDPETANPEDYELVSASGNPSSIIEGLTAGTVYYWYVQSNCGEGEVSEWSVQGVINTSCLAVSVLPFVENFDTWGTGPDAFPDCWTRPVVYAEDNIFPSCNGYDYISSPYSLKFQSEPTAPTYAVTPAFAEDIHGLMATFSLMAESVSYSGIIEVGVMSNPNDISTFELVQTIIPTSSDEWTSYEIFFTQTELSGANNYIAFRHISNNNDWYFWLEDLTIDLLPACLKPTNLYANNITTTSATLQWTETGSATNWNVKVSLDPINPETADPADYELVSVSGNPSVIIEDLALSTTYYWYVQADCGEGEASAWSAQGVFVTNCNSYTIPFLEDFTENTSSELPSCWNQNYTNWSVNESSNAQGDSPELRLNWEPSVIGEVKIYLPTIDATTNSNLGMTFDHTLDYYESSFDLRVDYTIDNGITWGTAWQTNVNSDIEPEEVLIDLSSLDGQVFQLAFVFSGNTYDVNDWYIDNINVFEINAINQIDINSEVSDVYVCKGDSKATAMAALAPQITITDTHGDEYVVDLTWGINSYNGNIPNSYNAKGIFTLPDGVEQTMIPTPLSVSALVIVNDPLVIPFSFATEYCIGSTPDALPLISDNFITGTWLPAEIATDIDGDIDYTFTPTAGQCATNQTLTITVNALPVVTCPADFTVIEQDVIALSGGLPAGGTYSGAGVTANTFDPSSLENGEYTITYTYTDEDTGCSNSCEFKITIDVVISINENEIAKIGVYPNPNNGKFNISFNNINGKVVYQIYDTKGSVIADKIIHADGNTIEEVSLNLIPGVYFVKVITTNQSYVEKLVIQ